KEGFCQAFWPPGPARDHPGGQWKPVCLARAGWIFAVERVVDAAGDTGRVDAAGLPARQRFARAVSPGDEAGKDATCGPQQTGPATPLRFVAAEIQPPTAARGIGAKGARPAVSQEPPKIYRKTGRDSLWPELSRSQSSQQRRNPVGGKKAIYWRGLCGAMGGAA